MAAYESPTTNDWKLPKYDALETLSPINFACHRGAVNQNSPQTSATEPTETFRHSGAIDVDLKIIIIVFFSCNGFWVDEVTTNLYCCVRVSKDTQFLGSAHCNPTFQTFSIQMPWRRFEVFEDLKRLNPTCQLGRNAKKRQILTPFVPFNARLW